MEQMGKWLIFLGIAIAIVGLILVISDRFGFPGKLPGDIYIRKGNFQIYIPVVSSVILSLLLTGFLWLVQHLIRK